MKEWSKKARGGRSGGENDDREKINEEEESKEEVTFITEAIKTLSM